jgi:hypothetical protein
MAKDVPKGKWSLWWDNCQNCGTNEIPHKADGLCRRCYMWFYRQQRKLGFITRRIKGLVVRGKKARGKKAKQETRGVPKEAQ